LENRKNFKKKFENRFFQRGQKSLPEVPLGVRNHSGGRWDLWNPFSTLPKKSIFKKNFDFLRFFLAVGVGLLIFDFGPADHRRVPGGCPTHYFTYSWASGEYLRTLVCPHRATSRPVLARNPRIAEHRLKYYLASKSVF